MFNKHQAFTSIFILILLRFLTCQASNYGGGGGGYGSAPVPASIQSYHRVQYYEVPSTGYPRPTSIEVGANIIPLNLLFRSASSYLNVQQQHIGAPGSNQESSSEDEAHILRHTVTKPIYQEIREVITPYRKIIQEVRPVQEAIQTIVARGVGPRSLSDVSGSYGGSNRAY